jgi:lysyl-tRNA synthetase class 2
MMELLENMMAEVVEDLVGGLKITNAGNELDFSPPWKRASYFGLLEEATSADLIATDVEETLKVAEKHGIEITTKFPKGKVLDQMFEELVQPKLIEPTFVMDYPRDISPLAKASRKNPRVVERFEPFIAALEIGNAFSEQSDPEEQRKAMLEQMEYRKRGDQEAQVLDEEYLVSLEHGLPPTGGLGIGLDRVTMVLTDNKSIRDVILFPQLREERTE